MTEHCISCGIESGSLLVCHSCRRSHPTGHFDRQFQIRVCADAGWVCSSCGADCSEPEWRRALVCAHHHFGKNSRPDFRYDLSKASCICGAGVNDCHNKEHMGLSPPSRSKYE